MNIPNTPNVNDRHFMNVQQTFSGFTDSQNALKKDITNKRINDIAKDEVCFANKYIEADNGSGKGNFADFKDSNSQKGVVSGYDKDVKVDLKYNTDTKKPLKLEAKSDNGHFLKSVEWDNKGNLKKVAEMRTEGKHYTENVEIYESHTGSLYYEERNQWVGFD